MPDAFETALLERFAPDFLISARECDGLPAEFLPGSPEPRVVARNGTIYGQVFENLGPGWPGALVEIHYYHLWGRDCGRIAHALDVEHVSVLLRAEHRHAPVTAWTALYWYAAAHEDTVCDASHGAGADTVDAVDQGPRVWISRGKHASFLSQRRCAWGCGGDRCDEMISVPTERVINLGEPGAPLGAASWIGSTAWPLAVKMQSDFSNRVLTRLHKAKAGQVVALNGLQQPWQAMILSGDSTADAVAVSNRETGKAVGIAGMSTGRALATSAAKVGASLGRSGRSVWRFLRGAGPEP
ncbi:MAG: hypothetical protein GEV06_26375 [Luteitalea sp.]|nr:hypothetical protein [Luteitalea sp.]